MYGLSGSIYRSIANCIKYFCRMKIQEAIASGLGIQTADVMYLTVHTQDVCASASFAVLGM